MEDANPKLELGLPLKNPPGISVGIYWTAAICIFGFAKFNENQATDKMRDGFWTRQTIAYFFKGVIGSLSQMQEKAASLRNARFWARSFDNLHAIFPNFLKRA